jgi:hypothetical protein
MLSIDSMWEQPIYRNECGHERCPLPTLDVIESEMFGAEDWHGARVLGFDCYDD